MMGLYGNIGWIKRPGKKKKQLALDALGKLGMKEYWDRQISKLSGGQQQRTFSKSFSARCRSLPNG